MAHLEYDGRHADHRPTRPHLFAAQVWRELALAYAGQKQDADAAVCVTQVTSKWRPGADAPSRAAPARGAHSRADRLNQAIGVRSRLNRLHCKIGLLYQASPPHRSATLPPAPLGRAS